MKCCLQIAYGVIWCVVLSFGTISGRSAPFTRQYTIGLRDISLNGDLLLSCPVGKVSLGSKYTADIWLEHKLESLDYCEVRSRFIMHPFETGVFRLDPSSWRWLRPGGGELIFSKFNSVEGLPVRPMPRLWSRIGLVDELKVFEQNAVQLWSTGSGWEIICDDGWELYHRNGVLEHILTPDGSELTITANGKFIVSMSREGMPIAQLQWRSEGVPRQIEVRGTVFVFNLGARSLLEGVVDKTGVIYSFSYQENDLLQEISKRGEPKISFSWNPSDKNGVNASLPYCLSKAGDAEYSYTRQGGRTKIEVVSHGSTEHLEVVTRYGRILKISNDD